MPSEMLSGTRTTRAVDVRSLGVGADADAPAYATRSPRAKLDDVLGDRFDDADRFDTESARQIYLELPFRCSRSMSLMPIAV